MKRFFLLSAMLAALGAMSGVAHAHGNGHGEGMCKPLCDTDKRECRSDAASAAEEDKSPLLAMPDRNEFSRVSQGMSGKPTEAQARQGYESRRVTLQRTCDTQYLRCIQACAKQETATGK